MDMVLDLPLLRANPVVGSCAVPEPDSRPGHIVRRHLLTILKEAEWTSVKTKNGRKKNEVGQKEMEKFREKIKIKNWSFRGGSWV
jgi:hypothetical protein